MTKTDADDLNGTAAIERLKELVEDIDFTMLTTRDAHVSVAGRARVVHDHAKMKDLYTPDLDIWFESGLETPGIVLLRVTPVECEFWEPRHGKIVTAAGMLKALVTKDTPDDTMRHGRVSC